MFNLNVQSNPQMETQSVPHSEEILCDKACPASGYQLANVCVPVTIIPFAEAKKPIANCIGDPVVTPGKDACCGHHNGCCSFTISQRICVEVPVIFGAKAVVGETIVDCECTSAKDICKKYGDFYREDTSN